MPQQTKNESPHKLLKPRKSAVRLREENGVRKENQLKSHLSQSPWQGYKTKELL